VLDPRAIPRHPDPSIGDHRRMSRVASNARSVAIPGAGIASMDGRVSWHIKKSPYISKNRDLVLPRGIRIHQSRHTKSEFERDSRRSRKFGVRIRRSITLMSSLLEAAGKKSNHRSEFDSRATPLNPVPSIGDHRVRAMGASNARSDVTRVAGIIAVDGRVLRHIKKSPYIFVEISRFSSSPT
jgi:hypothetical protein